MRILLATLIAAPLLAGCVTEQASLGSGKLADWEASAAREPEAGSLHAMARLYASQGRDEQAEATLRELVGKAPDFLPAYEELARLYVKRDLLDGAIAALELGLQHHDRDPVLLNDLGLCRLLQKDLAAAAEAFTRAAAASADDTRARSNLALVLGLMGRDDEALALWRQVLPAAEAAANLARVAQAR